MVLLVLLLLLLLLLLLAVAAAGGGVGVVAVIVVATAASAFDYDWYGSRGNSCSRAKLMRALNPSPKEQRPRMVGRKQKKKADIIITSLKSRKPEAKKKNRALNERSTPGLHHLVATIVSMKAMQTSYSNVSQL